MAEKDIGNDNVLGAYCHFPVIGGIFVPLIVYLLKGKENKELGFQAKQALVYQLFVALIAFLGAIAITIMSFIFLSISDSIGGLLAMVFWLIYVVILLAFTVIALLAAWKTYSKVSYEYPLIGKRLR